MESHLNCLYLKCNNDLDDDNEFKDESDNVPCLICDEKFLPQNDDDGDDDKRDGICVTLQHHLLSKHNMMIADINTIADLRYYCIYWKKKIEKCDDLNKICAVINTNSGPTDCGTSEYYYMIGGDAKIFTEDTELRSRLQNEKIASILSQSQKERDDVNFSHRCLFCRKMFIGNRSTLFDHITHDHNFSIGHPNNVVFCEKLLDLLDTKLTQLQCLYCEKIFKSWAVLKEHMRKKGHKLLNPNNRQYDQFYLINYLSPGKHWKSVKDEDDDGNKKSDDAEEWGDWIDESQSNCICLFCQFSAPIEELKDHLLNVHNFNFNSIIIKLDFYLRIKLVNYIRRCVHENKCHHCHESFPDRDDLLVHLEFANHTCELPNQSVWDLPEYFFSTYENDNLLHFLADDSDEDDEVSHS